MKKALTFVLLCLTALSFGYNLIEEDPLSGQDHAIQIIATHIKADLDDEGDQALVTALAEKAVTNNYSATFLNQLAVRAYLLLDDDAEAHIALSVQIFERAAQWLQANRQIKARTPRDRLALAYLQCHTWTHDTFMAELETVLTGPPQDVDAITKGYKTYHDGPLAARFAAEKAALAQERAALEHTTDGVLFSR